MEEKIAQYRKMLSENPKSKAFVPLAELYRKSSLLDDALEVAEHGVQAQPDYALGYVVLARIQAQRGLLEESVSSFERALEIDGDNVDALKGLARILVARDNNRRARDLLVRVLSIKPDDKTSRQMLEFLGPPPETPEYGSDAEEEEGDVDSITTATIAEIYLKQGYPRRALQVYRELLTAHPDSALYRNRVHELEMQLEEEDASGAFASDEVGPAAPTDADASPDKAVVPPEVSAREETPSADFSAASDSESSIVNGPAPDTEDRLVDSLTDWLDAICAYRSARQKREENV